MARGSGDDGELIERRAVLAATTAQLLKPSDGGYCVRFSEGRVLRRWRGV
jgi:hypothetical protein